MGIAAVWAEWGAAPPLAALLTALVSGVGLAQLAALPPIPQYAEGNYRKVVGQSDGRTYNARMIDSHSSGLFNDPTFIKGFGLVGDAEKQELVFNPVDTQKILDSDYLLSAINETLDVPQFAQGNKETVIKDSNTTNNMYSDPLLLEALTRLNENLESPLMATLLANEDYVRTHNKIVEQVDSLHAEIDQ